MLSFAAIMLASCGGYNSSTPKRDSTASATLINSADSFGADPAFEAVQTYDIDSALHTSLSWAVPLVQRYIQTTESQLIKQAREKGTNDEFLWDRLETNYDEVYVVFHIGHDLINADSSRFVTDGWLYIDTTTRDLFEYDAIADSICKWSH